MDEMNKEEIKREINWQERSAKISGSWGDKAGKRKALKKAEQLRNQLNKLEEQDTK